jgi:hypothetical protein
MFLLVFLTAIAMPIGLHATLTNFGFLQQIVSAGALLPAIVETGNAVETFTVPQNIQRPVAIGPDGSSYAVYNSYYVVKIAPDGSTSYIAIQFPVPNHATEYGGIVYADGYLWFESFEGYIHMKPDGTNVTYHQQQFGNPLTAAPNGVYVTLTGGVEFIDGTTFKRTLYPVIYNGVQQNRSVGAMTIGPDGRLYVDFTPNTSSVDMLARLESDGTYTFFGKKNTACGRPTAYQYARFVSTKQAIYFIGEPNESSYDLCRVSYTGLFTRLTAPFTYTVSSSRYSPQEAIDADNAGNVWVANVIGTGLYSYSAATAQTLGPYEPTVLQNLGGYLRVGPDQNVWLYGLYANYQSFYGAYVRHYESFMPTSVNLSFVGQNIDFMVSETLKSGPWTAYSLNPSVATVGPGSFLLGKFDVTAVSPGSTAIVITDAYGNSRNEPVTVTVSPVLH